MELQIIDAKPGETVLDYTGVECAKLAISTAEGGSHVLNAFLDGQLVGSLQLKHPRLGREGWLEQLWIKSIFIREPYRASTELGAGLRIWQRWLAEIEARYPQLPLLTNEEFCEQHFDVGLFTNPIVKERLLAENLRRGFAAEQPA